MKDQGNDHAQEPWKMLERNQQLRDGREVVDIVGNTSKSPEHWEIVGVKVLRPDARRAIAAVNACKGIPIGHLEEGVIGELINACKTASIGFAERTGENQFAKDSICHRAQEAGLDTSTYILKLLSDVLAKIGYSDLYKHETSKANAQA